MSAKLCPIALAVSGAILLSACGGGGGSSSSGTATPSSVDVTVTPSLGKFSTNCSVDLRRGTGELLGSSTVSANGTAVIKVTDYTGPIIAQIKGASGCTYFDEASGTDRDFGTGQKLSAIIDTLRSDIGVNTLTHIAAGRLLDGDKLITGKTADNVKQENATVQLMFQVGDMFSPPKLIGSANDTIDNTEAGRLAAKLAALAEIANTLSKDVATLAAELATDLKDGALDTLNNAQLQAGLTAAINKFAEAGSKQALLELPARTTLSTNISTVKTDVDKVLAAGNSLQQAKQIFADLRTSLMSISNDAGTGSLDEQNKQLQADFKAGVDINQTFGSISLMNDAIRDIILGTETQVGYDWTDGVCTKTSGSSVECEFYSSELSRVYVVDLNVTGANTVEWEVIGDYDPSTDNPFHRLSGLTGTITRTSSTAQTIVGNFYPMTGDAAKTAVNLNYTYSGVKGQQAWSGNGTLNALKTDGTTSTLKLEATEVAISETAKTAKFVAVLTSPHHRFEGTLSGSGETISKNGNSSPKDLRFVGSFTNTATGFKFLDGTLTGSLDWSNLDSSKPDSVFNYDKFSLSFKGTAYKAANVLGVGLDLTAGNTSFTQRFAEFTFTGTNGLTIKGSGTQVHSIDGNAPSTWTLTNANGISATYDDATKSGKVLKADGSTLGTISSQRVTFIDGTFESLI